MNQKTSTYPTATHPPSLHTLIEQAQRADELFPQQVDRRTHVVVAVSGGADSVCLLHLLAAHASEWQLDLMVAHIDHALRPDSANDADVVRRLAEQLHLPLIVSKLDGDALRTDPAGLEAAARRERYRALCAIAINAAPAGQVPIVAVAHHARDQAETLLLRLVQGSGLPGLAAMRQITVIDDKSMASRPVRVVRPLLAASHEAIVAYTRQHHLIWREDSTNQDETRTRNLIRRQVLPVLAQINPQVVSTLARTAALLAEDAERIHALDAQLMQQVVVHQDDLRILLDLPALRTLSEHEARGVLRSALAYLGADLRQIGSEQIKALARSALHQRRLSGPHPLSGALAWSVVAELDGPQRLALHRADTLPLLPPGPWLDERWRSEVLRVPLPSEGCVAYGKWILECSIQGRNEAFVELAGERWCAWFDAALLDEPMLTTPRPGLVIDPLGMNGAHKRLGDLFTDKKVAPALRRGWPVIESGTSGHLLWVCGLAQSHGARVTAQTQSVWRICWHHRS